jgi:hypothetical protein
MYTEFWWGNLVEISYLKNKVGDWRITLKCILYGNRL